ncbi:MAG: RNA 2',3'-cyclic phosphodiesterase [Candidatus Acidiferrales bacterium]
MAIEVPEDARRALGDLRARLAHLCAGARFVEPGGMHVTLKFIGEAAAPAVEKIKTVLGEIHLGQAIEIRFAGLGFFPNDRHPRVFWAGIDSSPPLAELAAAIERALAPLGIAPEERAFRAHLTLARFKSENGLAQLRGEIARLAVPEFGATRANTFHLIESKLKPGGAVYTTLASFRFAEAA